MKHPMQQQPQEQSFWRSPAGIVCIGLLAIGAFMLLTEHTTHVFAWLPYMLLLACPLMHLFHHRHRQEHSGRSERERDNSAF